MFASCMSSPRQPCRVVLLVRCCAALPASAPPQSEPFPEAFPLSNTPDGPSVLGAHLHACVHRTQDTHRGTVMLTLCVHGAGRAEAGGRVAGQPDAHHNGPATHGAHAYGRGLRREHRHERGAAVGRALLAPHAPPLPSPCWRYASVDQCEVALRRGGCKSRYSS